MSTVFARLRCNPLPLSKQKLRFCLQKLRFRDKDGHAAQQSARQPGRMCRHGPPWRCHSGGDGWREQLTRWRRPPCTAPQPAARSHPPAAPAQHAARRPACARALPQQPQVAQATVPPEQPRSRCGSPPLPGGCLTRRQPLPACRMRRHCLCALAIRTGCFAC